jgi:hypothetical protein
MKESTARRGRSGKQGKNAVGRPLTKLSDLDPNWEATMTTLYQEGASDVEVMVALAIPPARAMSDDLWYGLMEREPDFSRAVKSGHKLAETWWQQQARKGLYMEGFKTTLWIVQMRNRFGFKGADRSSPPPAIDTAEQKDEVTI